jgi:hypothetical protein
MTTPEESVALGVQELDKEFPNGWRDRISQTMLDMHHANLCVLGQLFGAFGEAPYHLTNHPAFTCFDHSYDELDTAWRKELSK